MTEREVTLILSTSLSCDQNCCLANMTRSQQVSPKHSAILTIYRHRGEQNYTTVCYNVAKEILCCCLKSIFQFFCTQHKKIYAKPCKYSSNSFQTRYFKKGEIGRLLFLQRLPEQLSTSHGCTNWAKYTSCQAHRISLDMIQITLTRCELSFYILDV